MFDEIDQRLSRFTPQRGGIDRDTLFFVAGQRSVRPDRRWKSLTAFLALSQTLTLLFLLRPPTTTVPPASGPLRESPVVQAAPRERPAPEREPWRGLWIDDPLTTPPSVGNEDVPPDAPPLRAFTRQVDEFLN